MYQATVRNSGAWDGTLRSDWSFDTVRTSSAMGSLRSMAKDLIPQDTIPDEYEEDESMYSVEPSVGASAVTTRDGGGQRSSSGLGANADALHSTVIIRPLSPPADERDVPGLSADSSSGETCDSEIATPPQESRSDLSELPPAYTGSMRSARRASFAARNNVNGTIIGEADLGTGVDTIRPVKKVDTVRSLRLSSEFVGTTRSRESSLSAPSSPQHSPKSSYKPIPSSTTNAGKSLVNEVILPAVTRVSPMLLAVLDSVD